MWVKNGDLMLVKGVLESLTCLTFCECLLVSLRPGEVKKIEKGPLFCF
jgi:hypothetical protein